MGDSSCFGPAPVLVVATLAEREPGLDFVPDADEATGGTVATARATRTRRPEVTSDLEVAPRDLLERPEHEVAPHRAEALVEALQQEDGRARGAAEPEAALLEVAALEGEGARRGVEDDVALLEDAVDVFVALRGDRLAGEGLLLEA